MRDRQTDGQTPVELKKKEIESQLRLLTLKRKAAGAAAKLDALQQNEDIVSG